ncbi:MAG: SDR family oxidoreductase [Nanoarchaeota archaeon]
MKRLEDIAKSRRLNGKRIVVTGCGYKPATNTFRDIVSGEDSADYISIDHKKMKANIGTAVAGFLARNGAIVHMVSTSEDKLQNIKDALEKDVGSGLIEYSALDLLDGAQVKKFVESLPKDKNLYWVQSVGLGAGSYKLKDDNPYLPLDQIPLDLLENESNTVLRSTHLMMQNLLPLFRKQRESRIAIVSSMSAIRGYSYGGTHCAAKGAIDRYANSAMLSNYKDNIFLTTIRPGAVDTGMYDNLSVQEAVKVISDEYNGIWRKQITLAPPTSVGEAVNYVFTTSAHIPSLNLVAKGQFPNEGS